MRFGDDGRYDEMLLLVVSAVGLALVALFAATPVLRPYYALLMPLTITAVAGGAWALLRFRRMAGNGAPPATTADLNRGARPGTG